VKGEGVHPNKNLPLCCCISRQSDPISCWAI